MRKPKKEIHLTSYEELLGIEDNQENSVRQNPLSGPVKMIKG